MLSPLLLIAIVFFLPLILFVLPFGLLFFALRYPGRYKWLFSIGISYILIYGVKVLFFKTAYDSSAMGGITNFIHIFPDYFTTTSNKNFINWIIKDYYWLAVFPPIIVFYYFRSKQWKKRILFVSFFCGLVLLINTVNYKGEAQQFYLEPQYTILSVYIGFVLVYDILPQFSRPTIPVITLSLITALCLLRIHNVDKEYTARVNLIREMLHTTRDKTVLSQDSVRMDVLKKTWGISFESWLLSTIETGKTQSMIVSERPGEFDWTLENPSAWITKWEVFGYDKLPSNYFVFPGTVRPYKR